MSSRAIRSALVIWALAGCLVVIAVTVAVIVISVHNSHLSSQHRQALERDHLWRVVAGQVSGDEPTVTNKFGLDLKDLLASGRPLDSFRGSSNAYGGITSAIGVDPFNGQDYGCVECGPLTAYMKTNLAAIDSGDLNRALASDRVSAKHESVLLPLLVLALWLATLPLILAGPSLRRFRRLSCTARRYPDEVRLVKQLDSALHSLPPGHPQRREILSLRDGLETALELRMSAGQAVDYRELSNDRLNQLVAEARNSLTAYDAGNRMLEGGT